MSGSGNYQSSINTNCRKQYLKRFFYDTGSFSPSIVVQIIDPKREHISLVNSGELFRYLRHNYKTDFIIYISEMTTLIINHKPLILDKPIEGILNVDLGKNTLAHQIMSKGGFSAVKNYYKEHQEDLNKSSTSLFGLELFFKNNYIIRRGDLTPAFDIREFECK